MALPGTGEEGRGEMLREPREPAAGGVGGEAQRPLMLDFQPRVPSCNQDSTPRLNWKINKTIYRRKGRTGEPPWRLEPEPGTEGRHSHA